MAPRPVLTMILFPGVAWLLLAAGAGAAPGDLDYGFAGFGAGGVVTVPGVTDCMAIAPDGRIVVAGQDGIGVTVRRFEADGSVDLSLDGDGAATLLNPNFVLRVSGVAVQPDGKIILAGWAEAGTDDFLVMRLLPTGVLDVSFGAGGYVTTDFTGQTDQAKGVSRQADGRIVLAGTSSVGGDTDFSIARYEANGALDSSFSGDGKVTIGFGGDDACNDLAIQSDGKIVLVGSYDPGFPTYDVDFAVARLNVDGSLDSTFDFDGKRTTGLGDNDIATAVAIQADDKIVVAGVRDPSSPDGVLARFHPSGLLDNSLDGDGKMTASDDWLRDVVVQPDGRILMIGEHWAPGPDKQLALHRILDDGSLDSSFAGDGQAFLDLGIADFAQSVALLPDGRILAHGTTGPGVLTQNATHLVRLWQDGSLDAGAHQALGYPDSYLGSGALERVTGIVVQPDHKIVVVGEIQNLAGTETDFAVARLLPDGELDSDFGTFGVTTFSFHNFDVARAVALQDDGKIVVAGHTGSGDGINFLVVRFMPDGSLDPAFGFFGYNVLDFLGGADYAQAVAIAPDGKIVLAGTVYNGVRYVFGSCRFTSDGVVDASFDADGKQLHEISLGALHEATSVVVQDDLKVVVGGHVGGDFALARYQENGLVDFGWGVGGQGYSLIDMGGDDYLGALTIAVGGWFYAAGSRTLGGSTDFAVAQLIPDGLLATCSGFPCFNWATGKAYVDWGGYDVALAVDWRSDGQIAVAGCASGQLGWAQFSTRSPDAPWKGVADLVGAGECIEGIRFDGSNHLIAASTQEIGGDQNFVVTRFEASPNPFDATGVREPTTVTHTAFRLGATIPNPSRGGSMISFELERPQTVRIVLYDAAGRRVRMLVDGPFPIGRHEREWDGNDDGGSAVAAGVYFLRASAGPTQLRQKILVLK